MSAPGGFTDRYAIETLLGQGGSGRVYRAYDRVAKRWVALKLLVASHEERNRERFRREALLMQNIRHPHIVVAHDAGEALDGTPYIAYELLQGETLRDLLRREGAQPCARVVTLATELLSALDHAHALGVIHRDIKPSNVFLHVNPAGTVSAKLIDFGIAVCGISSIRLTATGEYV